MPLRKLRDTSGNPPPGWDSELYGIAASRAKKRTDFELHNWAEIALGSMGAALNEYRQDGDPDRLQDLRLAMISFWAMLIELGIRNEAGKQLRL